MISMGLSNLSMSVIFLSLFIAVKKGSFSSSGINSALISNYFGEIFSNCCMVEYKFTALTELRVQIVPSKT